MNSESFTDGGLCHNEGKSMNCRNFSNANGSSNNSNIVNGGNVANGCQWLGGQW
ncbi:hypothetical protein AB0K16_54580 [Nonomuraea jabiensis]|uniref:hypothetical protein n=1 Tax=Nonomuraea jabiensis TaxID=882448 RepID=UPI003428BAF3